MNGENAYLVFNGDIIECIHCGLLISYNGKPVILLACDEKVLPYCTSDNGYSLEHVEMYCSTTSILADEWRKTLFGTRKEAEEKLKKMVKS